MQWLSSFINSRVIGINVVVSVRSWSMFTWPRCFFLYSRMNWLFMSVKSACTSTKVLCLIHTSWFSFLGHLPPVLSTVEMFSIIDEHLWCLEERLGDWRQQEEVARHTCSQKNTHFQTCCLFPGVCICTFCIHYVICNISFQKLISDGYMAHSCQ